MTNGIPAEGAPARVHPDAHANANDLLYHVWEQLARLANLHAQEVMRFAVDPESFTAHDVVLAWAEVNRKVNRAMLHLASVTETITSQRDAIVAALERALNEEEPED